jgi:type I restriction enzyme S subunit
MAPDIQLRPDDVLVTKDGSIGKVALVDDLPGPAALNSHLLVIRPLRGTFTARFLFYVLTSRFFGEFIEVEKRGTTFDGLTQESMGRFLMPLPPLATQRAIADYLDRETARIDALITAKRRMIEVLEERFQTARSLLVVGDSCKGARNRGPRWLGNVPAHWAISRLKFVAHMDSGHTPDRKVPEYWIDCRIPWVTLNDVGVLETSWEFLEPTNAINDLGMAHSAAHVIPARSVILSRDATVGRAAILGTPMAVSQHFVSWTCTGALLPEYLLHVFRGPMQTHFQTLTAGATIATIGMPELLELVVPVPPLAEQEAIAGDVGNLQRVHDLGTRRLIEQVALLQERRQTLVTAAVTGELEIPEAAV